MILKEKHPKMHYSNTLNKVQRLFTKYQKILGKHPNRLTDTQKANETRFFIETYHTPFIVPLTTEAKEQTVDVENESGDEVQDDENHDPNFEPPPAKKIKMNNFAETLKKAQKHPLVTGMLDRTLTTNNNMTLIMGAVVTAAKLDVNDALIGSSTLYEARKKNRAQLNHDITSDFVKKVKDENIPLVLHWDGKLMQNTTREEGEASVVDRLPIVVSGHGVCKTISIPKLSTGTGLAMAEAVFDVLESVDLVDHVIAFTFDTTASNTGHINGAAVLLNARFKKNRLLFECRHHVAELYVGAAYVTIFGKTESPTLVKIFDDLRENWPVISKTQPKRLGKFGRGKKLLEGIKQETIDFLRSLNEHYFLRDDYKEMLELTLFIIDPTFPPPSFKKPGSVSNCRFMGKGNYFQKFFIFRDALCPSKEVLDKVVDMVIFIVHLYTKYWFSCPATADAAYNDIELIKNLEIYAKVNKKVASAVLSKIKLHTCYLTPENIGLCLFSNKVSVIEKQAIVKKMKAIKKKWNERQTSIKLPSKISLLECVGDISYDAISIISPKIEELLNHDPEEWQTLTLYSECKKIVSNITIVNDPAERGVKLAKDINTFGTRSETEKQKLVSVVEHFRKIVPKPTKKNLSKLKI